MKNSRSTFTPQDFFELSQDLICSAGFDGYFKYLNSAWEKILGYTLEELLATPFINFIHPDDHQKNDEEVSSLTKGKETIDFENRYICKDGSIRYIHWKATPVVEQKLMYCIGRDITQKKKDEILFNNFIEQSSVAIHIYSIDGKLINTNKAFSVLFALNDETLSELYEKYNILEDEQAKTIGMMPYIKEIFAGNSTRYPIYKYSGVDTLKTLDIKNPIYQECWLHTKGFQLRDEDGNINRTVFMSEDITAQKEFEEKLKISEKNYKGLYKNALVAMLRTEFQDGKILNANKEAAKLFGYPNIEEFKKNFRSINHYANPDDREPILKELKEKGQINKVMMRFKKVDGTLIWTETSFSLDKENGYIDCISFDISKRVNAELELEKSETKFRHIFEQSMVSMFITDNKGFVIDYNSAYKKGLGFSTKELQEIHAEYNILKDKELERLKLSHLVAKVFRGKQVTFPVMPYEILNVLGSFTKVLPKKEIFWIRTRLYPLKNEAGEVTNVVVFLDDVSQLKEHEAQLIKAKEKAEESDRLKSAFLANMSHEIRTPMNGILGFSSLLREPGIESEEQQAYIKIIQKSGARMLNILSEIVAISKIESGTVDLQIKQVNINKKMEYVYELLKPDANIKALNFLLKNSLNLTETIIKTDEGKLDSILTNLVKNAIKYTDKGSIEFGYNSKEIDGSNFLEFYVKDTGIGIKKDRQDAIFERFIQADIEDVEARQGAGLGLAIVKSYVEMLGGKVWIESKIEIGSTFYFTIPYNSELKEKNDSQNDLPSEKTHNQINPSLSELKILITDDDQTSLIYLSTIIKKITNKVLVASSGIEAVKICQSNPDINLVLMDIQMPEMNGYEATKQIRKFNKEVIIVAQTAFAMAGDREKAIAAGCDTYISKPIDKDKLVALIQNVLKNN